MSVETKYLCDRCGKDSNKIFYWFNIKRGASNIDVQLVICGECEGDFKKWLKTKRN
jgi:hypothetical protein